MKRMKQRDRIREWISLADTFVVDDGGISVMETKREDIRLQRTYSLLLEALTDLLAEKPFDEIRVTDICERAKVHRSTFVSLAPRSL